jgi:hypothetical protein
MLIDRNTKHYLCARMQIGWTILEHGFNIHVLGILSPLHACTHAHTTACVKIDHKNRNTLSEQWPYVNNRCAFFLTTSSTIL